MKLFLHRWADVGVNDNRDIISPSADTCGLAGYEAVEEIEVEAPEQLTAQDDKLYWRGFEARLADGASAIIVYDCMSRDRIGDLKIVSRQAV